jgi:hypothetical protein
LVKPEGYRTWHGTRRTRKGMIEENPKKICEQDLSVCRSELNRDCCQLYSSLQYSICRHLRTLPRDQHFNMFPWANLVINSTRIPITYPAASITKIGAIVAMLTSILDGCSSGFLEGTTWWRILIWIPVSRICANLWRKLYYVKGLVHQNILNRITKSLWAWLYKIKRKNNCE